jgi:hypothetical protein
MDAVGAAAARWEQTDAPARGVDHDRGVRVPLAFTGEQSITLWEGGPVEPGVDALGDCPMAAGQRAAFGG